MKKLLTATLATALIASSFGGTASADIRNFPDVPETNVHYDNIYNLAERSILTGYPDGSFKPSRYVTRAEAASILYNALELQNWEPQDQGFTDVKPGDWFYEEVNVLIENNVISGHEGLYFGPHEKLTRAQLAKLLAAAYGLYTFDEKPSPFVDLVDGAWYKEYVESLYFFGVTSGVSASKFAPKQYVTRDTMASFIVNSEKVSQEKKEEEWIPYHVEGFNQKEFNPMQATVNLETNVVTVMVGQTDDTMRSNLARYLFHMILPIYDVEEAYIKGYDVPLGRLESEKFEAMMLETLGATYDTDLNELNGKSITFVFEGLYDEVFEYTVEFKSKK